MICLALVPAARSCELIPGSAVIEYRGCDVVLVSTRVLVARSNLRTVWSIEQEYVTVESSGLKITP